MISSVVTVPIDSGNFGRPLLAWWADNRREFSWRETSDPYKVLMAELLLRRTNAPAAQGVYTDFLNKYPTAFSFSRGKAKDIDSIARRLGLNWRAKNMVELSRHLRMHGEGIPENLEELSQLPGVGPYVARAVMVNCHGLRAVPVDANVVRVVCRFFALKESDSLRRNKQFQTLADSLVGHTDPRRFNFALLDLSASICRAHKPKCSICPLSAQCKSAGMLGLDSPSD